ncbi:MAG: RNA polymerase sigma factor [Flavobacteriales bacterium]|nr:RNA polymerase sigma factor [Flavobacteriales bacterium]
MELDEIIAGCYQGSRKHQEALYNMYASKMFGVCLTYTRDRDLAQDILHDGFFKVFKKFDKYDSQWNLSSWIRRIIVNTAIDHFRKSNRMTNIDFQESVYLAGGFDDVNEISKTDDLSEIINMLPQGAKTVFNLYTVEGYKHQEIADMLDISVGTSKSQLSKAKSVLRELVNKYYVR